MKKNITYLLLTILFLNTQNLLFAGDRKILVERFTSSTCVPCAQNNPIMDAFLSAQDPDKIIGLAFHMNWPSPGNDPMYLYNVPDNNTRRSYYGVNAIPQAYMDGIVPENAPYTQSGLQSDFNTRTALMSPVTIVVTDSAFGDSAMVKAQIYCEIPLANPNVTVQIAIMEKLIQYTYPPGTNGETHFTDVMRKMLTDANGTALTLLPGQFYTVSKKYHIDTLWHQDQVTPVVFVQASGKEVLNAAGITNNFTLYPNTGYKVVYQGQNQSADYQVQGPVVSAGYNSAVTLTASVDPPSSGINITFPSGNVISNFPGSAGVHVASTASVAAGVYRIIITGTNTNGKIHSTSFSYLVGKNYNFVTSNRANNTSIQFKVDNSLYNSLAFFTWDLSSSHSLASISPQTFGSIRYVFKTWSDGGDSTHNISIVPQTSLYTVNYGAQFKLMTSLVPSGIQAVIPGGNIYYDSSSTVTLSISPVQVQYNNMTYYFQRWQGAGIGSYSGVNVSVPLIMNNVIVETAIWDTIATIGIINLNTGIPKTYSLHQNYPNPFNPVTKIKFDLPKAGNVTIKLYDILGSEVATLFEGEQNAGYFSAEFDASNYASGIYFYRLKAGSFEDTKKMILIK